MEIVVATKLLEFAKSLFDLGGKLKEADITKKQNISQFLLKISETLSDLVDKTENGDDISSNCGELSTYMDYLMDVVSNYLSQEEVHKFSQALSQALIFRTLTDELTGHPERDKALKEIKEASGKFKALSNILLV